MKNESKNETKSERITVYDKINISKHGLDIAVIIISCLLALCLVLALVTSV